MMTTNASFNRNPIFLLLPPVKNFKIVKSFYFDQQLQTKNIIVYTVYYYYYYLYTQQAQTTLSLTHFHLQKKKKRKPKNHHLQRILLFFICKIIASLNFYLTSRTLLNLRRLSPSQCKQVKSYLYSAKFECTFNVRLAASRSTSTLQNKPLLHMPCYLRLIFRQFCSLLSTFENYVFYYVRPRPTTTKITNQVETKIHLLSFTTTTTLMTTSFLFVISWRASFPEYTNEQTLLFLSFVFHFECYRNYKTKLALKTQITTPHLNIFRYVLICY